MSCESRCCVPLTAIVKAFPQTVHRDSINSPIKGRTVDWKNCFSDEAIKRQKHIAPQLPPFAINIDKMDGGD